MKRYAERNYRYMMATKATHLLCDLSQKIPDLCIIKGEDGNDFIGEWVTGLGFINVRFPKATTRELTPEERKHFDGSELLVNSSWGKIFTDTWLDKMKRVVTKLMGRT